MELPKYGIFQKIWKTAKILKILEYGIFHKILKTAKILKILEYGIFQEYSRNMAKQQKFEKIWIWNIYWNIPRIFQKIENSSGGRKV